MKTWLLVCLKLLSVALPQICTSSPAWVPSSKLFWWIQSKQKTAKMNFCSALTGFWNNLGDDWAVITLWMPFPRLLPRDAFPELILRHRNCCRDTEQGELKQISGWIILKQLFLKSSHNGEMFWRKLLSYCWKSGQKKIVGKTNQHRNKSCQEGCPFFLPLQKMHEARPDTII